MKEPTEPQTTDKSKDPNERFLNLDIVNKTLISGTEAEIKELQEFHNLSNETMELLIHFQTLREDAHQQSRKESKERKETNPTPTEFEKRMGAYIEDIEPHMRDALKLIRTKGYSTYGCGFGEENTQFVGCTQNDFEKLLLPKEIKNILEEKEIEVEIEPDMLSLTLNQKISIEELKEIWDEIASALPDLQRHAPQSELPTANYFRKQ